MTFEKIAVIPSDPGGTLAAASSITTYVSTPRRPASARSSSQNASRNQRIAIPQ